MGDIVPLAARYRDEGADELVFYDITASPDGRTVSRDWVSRVTEVLDIPFCVAGGIRSVEDAEEILAAGAEKVSINTPALEDPDLIDRDGEYRVASHTGDPERARYGRRPTKEWVREVQDRGAGEIVMNCMNHDGVRTGYDVSHLAEIRDICSVPLIASGGAGAMEHFSQVFQAARVDGALAATVFHSGAIPIGDLKDYLANCGVEIRP
jgi:cyclase